MGKGGGAMGDYFVVARSEKRVARGPETDILATRYSLPQIFSSLMVLVLPEV